MNKNGKFRWAGLALLLAWLLPILACNYPGPARRQPAISKEELRQTLAAQVYPTVQAMTPAPGSTAVPPPDTVPFMGLRTATPEDPPQAGEPEAGADILPPSFVYTAQSGDTLSAVSLRFGVSPEDIVSLQELPAEAFLTPGQLLNIPNVLDEIPYPSALLPDSEVIYSPSTVDFHIGEFVSRAGGYLSLHTETVNGEWLSGADIIQRVALDSSTNPRLLLAFLEYRSNWVFGQPPDARRTSHPIGFHVPGYQGLYKELALTAQQLNTGYYGWRAGAHTELKFQDGTTARLSPEINAGSVALQHLFSKFYKQDVWLEALHGPQGFLSLHQAMFGDPWARAAAVEPLFAAEISQPELELPFTAGERWSLTGGPHIVWTTGTPRGALDFAPVTGEPACVVSRAWVTASAAGLVTRSSHNIVTIDLDGDGYEQTGWVLFFLHVAGRDRVAAGTWVNLDDPIGHPSCESGRSTGTHVHMARKFNGEWIAADGPLPFVLSGWRAWTGDRAYEGHLTKGELVVYANPGGPRTSIIVR